MNIELDDKIAEIASRMAVKSGLSLSDQIAVLVQIGSSIDSRADFDFRNIELALSGQIDTTKLTSLEDEVWLDCFTEM